MYLGKAAVLCPAVPMGKSVPVVSRCSYVCGLEPLDHLICAREKYVDEPSTRRAGQSGVAIRVGWPLPISSYEKAQRARRAFANKISVSGDSRNGPRTCRENERAIRPKLGNDVAKLGGECAAGLLIEGRGK